MSKKFLFSLLFCLILALPAHTTTTPPPDPVPGKGKTSSPKGTPGQVIVIRTAKDPKVNQIKVGEKGEILIPQSTAIAGAAIAGAAAGGAGSHGAARSVPNAADVGALKETEAGDDAKSSGDSNKAEGGGGFKGASGISGSGDSKPSGLSSSGYTGNDSGLLGGGVPSGFSTIPDTTPFVSPFTTASTSATTFTLTAIAGANGAISPSGVVTVYSGDSQTFTITPDSGYHVADVLVDGVSAGAVAGIAFTNVTANHTIVASFAALPTAQLQAILDLAVSDAGIPGAIMAVQTPTETWIGTAGKADLGDATQSRDPQAMTADTQVHLAGVTRLFTAALIMKLLEENKIKLDETVDQWLYPGAVPSSDQITLRMLLNHTSGLHDHETTQEFFSGLITYPFLPWDPFIDILPIMELYPGDFKPGTDFKYSSSDYFLLGMAAESTTMFTDTLENMIKTDFFDPLNLSHTALTPSGLVDQTNPFARSYYWAGVPEFPTLTDSTDWDLSFDWTNGSGVSTAQDILNFTTALFAGQVVNSQSLQQMTTPQQLTSAQGTLPYGFGLEVVTSDPWFGEKMYQSDGETVGAYARWLYYPDTGRTIFIAFNRGDKRFNTDPPLNPAPDAPQVDASQKADDLLKAASTLIKASQ